MVRLLKSYYIRRESILSVAQCCAVRYDKNGLARFLTKMAETVPLNSMFHLINLAIQTQNSVEQEDPWKWDENS